MFVFRDFNQVEKETLRTNSALTAQYVKPEGVTVLGLLELRN